MPRAGIGGGPLRGVLGVSFFDESGFFFVVIISSMKRSVKLSLPLRKGSKFN